jgi:hypothetical protein
MEISFGKASEQSFTEASKQVKMLLGQPSSW